jgi:ketosteroid isomerase-like protein
MVWVPTADAVMMIGGTQDNGAGWGQVIGETWWYRDSPPVATSVTTTPPNPDAGSTIVASVGPVDGGIGDVHVEYQWYVNGLLQADQTAATLFTTVHHGDTVQVKVRFHDLEGVYGPWVGSSVVTIANRAPRIQKVTLTPAKPSAIDTIRATPTGRDDDGDQVVYAKVRAHGRGKASEEEVEFDIHHVWRLRDGLFARMDAYLDEGEALEAAGLISDR